MGDGFQCVVAAQLLAHLLGGLGRLPRIPRPADLRDPASLQPSAQKRGPSVRKEVLRLRKVAQELAGLKRKLQSKRLELDGAKTELMGHQVAKRAKAENRVVTLGLAAGDEDSDEQCQAVMSTSPVGP